MDKNQKISVKFLSTEHFWNEENLYEERNSSMNNNSSKKIVNHHISTPLIKKVLNNSNVNFN